MNRDEKTAVVEELAGHLSAAQAVFAVDYKGISVTQAAELRTKLRESDASFKVVKNRLAKLAAAKSGTESLDELLIGPIALTLINGDAVVVAKTLTNFTKEHDVLEYKGGIMDGSALDVESFNAIAKLPALEVLHGQLVGLAASPLTGLVAGLSNMISGLGRQLAQIAEQGLVTGEAPAEAPAEEPAEASEAEPEPEPAADGAEGEAEASDDETTDETEENEEPSEEPAPEGADSEEADSSDETPEED